MRQRRLSAFALSYLADDVADVGQQLQREQVELLLTTMSDALQVLHPAA